VPWQGADGPQRSWYTDEEHETLQRWARRPKSSQALALRSCIALLVCENKAPIAPDGGRGTGIAGALLPTTSGPRESEDGPRHSSSGAEEQ
jgi:hypothetical protein